jgi:hypothetical protein
MPIISQSTQIFTEYPLLPGTEDTAMNKKDLSLAIMELEVYKRKQTHK